MQSADLRVASQSESRAANLATQRLSAAAGGPYVAGICRFCGCTEQIPCVLQLEPLETCGWAERSQTVCNADACLEKYEAELCSAEPGANYVGEPFRPWWDVEKYGMGPDCWICGAMMVRPQSGEALWECLSCGSRIEDSSTAASAPSS